MNSFPINRELTDDEFEDVLNEIYGTVDVCGFEQDSGRLLREIDPIAFDCAKADYEDGLEPEEWECGVCGCVYYSEDEAEDCCQIEDDE